MTTMADGQGLREVEPDPVSDPKEEQPDLEEEGERETGAGGSDEEEDVDVDGLASFLEFEILCGSSDEDPLDEEEKEMPVIHDAKKGKRKSDGDGSGSGSEDEHQKRARREKGKGKALPAEHPQIDTGMFMNIPVELFLQIFKFLSSEDLISCALVCRFMNAAASDETLWRRLYCMRWGLSSNATSNAKLRDCAWKNLYIQQDREDMVEFVRYTPTEFKEYYIQMQAAKRSQAPLPSEVNDDKIILDKTVADKVSSWKSRRGLTDDAVKGHSCSGSTCLYTQIGDAYICEKTGRVHVCDDACREFVLDQSSGLLVCTISGHCFERFLCPDDEWDTCDTDQQQGGVTDEAEPFMGSGRFARAYQLGYDCADEKELEHALRFC
ncbi:F-box protein SKIP31-like isoform X3 [Lolium rigidum]|uniref:F-box protein SKIP31-like isoform X3 n=1 Tax=Lolium rigidum TaxID=89674 RepID=UPI001F5D9B0C|nr:F-box protein SKIP31-like isoform X3 [Lolium rigidum]